MNWCIYCDKEIGEQVTICKDCWLDKYGNDISVFDEYKQSDEEC